MGVVVVDEVVGVEEGALLSVPVGFGGAGDAVSVAVAVVAAHAETTVAGDRNNSAGSAVVKVVVGGEQVAAGSVKRLARLVQVQADAVVPVAVVASRAMKARRLADSVRGAAQEISPIRVDAIAESPSWRNLAVAAEVVVEVEGDKAETVGVAFSFTPSMAPAEGSTTDSAANKKKMRKGGDFWGVMQPLEADERGNQKKREEKNRSNTI